MKSLWEWAQSVWVFIFMLVLVSTHHRGSAEGNMMLWGDQPCPQPSQGLHGESRERVAMVMDGMEARPGPSSTGTLSRWIWPLPLLTAVLNQGLFCPLGNTGQHWLQQWGMGWN